MAINLEEETKKLIAFRLITSTTGSFSDKARRSFEKIREELGTKLKKDPKMRLPKDSKLVLKLGWSDEAVSWARKINLAVEEFNQKYPKYGKELQKLISQHRSIRRAYLEFGGEVLDEVYIEIIRNMSDKIDYEKAAKIYEAVFYVGNVFGKDKEGLQKSILSE